MTNPCDGKEQCADPDCEACGNREFMDSLRAKDVDCQTAKPTDGGWVEKFDKEFNKHGFCDSDCSDYWLGAARTGVKASKIKSFIRQTVSAAVLAERQRCVEAVGSIPMPQWDVPETDGSMPDDPFTAADQMRISTVNEAIEAINRKSYEAQ